MKRVNTSPISGMQELLPSQQFNFDRLKAGVAEVFRAHAYQAIETPTIDRAEILFAKAGGDTEKQIYRVIKTNETAADADQALRFDHTVPLARYVVEHENDLPFPFKVSQIGRNFRGERAQRGRFREFYQCDIDVVGRDTLPVAYDADVVATLTETLEKVFGLGGLRVRVSNRKLLTGFCESLGLAEKTAVISRIIDHAEKVPVEKTLAAFEEEGIDPLKIEHLTKFMNISGAREEVIAKLREMRVQNEAFTAGIDELEQVLMMLEIQGASEKVVADMLIIRGLDYYTGTVFETFVAGHEEIGSICSGGRYDNLAGLFTEQKLPGVGGSIGLTRLYYILRENNLLKDLDQKPVDVALIPLSANEYPFTFDLAEKLRGEGKKVEVVLTERKLGDRFNYAAKIANKAAVIGENEVRSNSVTYKDLY